MATFFAHLILIVGAIGGLAFFAGFVLRLLSNGIEFITFASIRRTGEGLSKELVKTVR